jgi:hypothetical protein
MHRMIIIAALSCVIWIDALLAQQHDVTFFVIGKHANYSQNASGDRRAVDYSFFSEIFLTKDGDAIKAALTFPTGERVEYTDMRAAAGGGQDNILLYSGPDRFTELAAMQRRYPDGAYQVSFDAPSGNVVDARLLFENRGLPKPPVVRVAQGQKNNCAKLVPNADALVTWGSFEQGAADENGILDDLVFVILTDANGIRVAHSGRPFEGKPYLTFAASGFTISGQSIDANQNYTLSVEHAILDDTTLLGGVPAFTTRAVTTKLNITTGPLEMKSCQTAESNTAFNGHKAGVNIG